MKIIILAGGGGSRLFPLSRTCYPKQFLNIGNEQSLLVQTVQRFLPLVKPEDIVVITNQGYLHHVKAELAACQAEAAHIVLEPVGRNTAPAIALAVRYCLDELKLDSDEVLLVTPSDHIVQGSKSFIETVRKAAGLAAAGKLVTFGIKPDKPETGYGYIQAGSACQGGYVVQAFQEKPDRATAEKYLAAGNYFWNSGMFAFSIDCIMQELASYQPEIAELAAGGYAGLLADFAALPNISIDYAVAEKSNNVVTVPLTSYWNDIGSWDAIYEVLDKDEQGNAVHGDCMPVDCSNTLMLGRSRLIAGIGLEDLLVVETDDVILVAKKGESQKVKALVEKLRQQGRKEANENTTMYRPWGSYTVLGEGPGYKMKKITVSPGQRLSLQLHYHRSEHWIVTGGAARVTIGEEEKMVHENESVFVPQSTRHRLENPGRIPLEIIEVQNGSYLEEDDIVRFDDIYGRV
ncbi:mannose-1-phosphate guanylyltransferase/mannose-6-phosphate isomerase|uniref:mannose-1-phosphate guanylyltransferase n=1 Tax=Dendrosporobacter quercicolus TaxID=146817 RepID=A0A1G9WRK4_9FIRM|nr:mannose-1-phosphate guanylyltransferase/mannose-6-phosphate isomerase [Dendrosporobacter quercicolus]NSL49183.1 mannose-1-phosphate guanylyltransferase/mannose-6-phosphate isomerase [Dendrosporobacter quercicolus DSM 1736]SDM86831.1 mannose-1-phosphate guanylyltransferase / mannose-6-phosphate isomerase [Dendrosporobacter quercicolus]